MQLTSFKKETRNLSVIIYSELYFDSQVTKVLQFSRIKHNVQRLQLTQNATGRVLTVSKRHEYITPVFIAHHWLPVSRLVSKGDGAFICGSGSQAGNLSILLHLLHFLKLTFIVRPSSSHCKLILLSCHYFVCLDSTFIIGSAWWKVPNPV